MRLAGYIRVSTGGQIDGFGPEVQREMIESWAEISGHTLTHWVEDLGVSGTIEGAERPGIGELLVLAEDGEVEGVVAAEVTRLARDLIVQESLLGSLWAKGLKVFTVAGGEIADNSDPMRAMVRQIVGVFAQFERATIVSRMRNGRQAKLRSGGYGGGLPPFGYRVEGSGRSAVLVPDEEEQFAVRLMVDMRSRPVGGVIRSYDNIAAYLNESGYRTKTGARWSGTQVMRCLKRHKQEEAA